MLCQERDARAAQRQSFIQQLQDEQAAAEAALEHLKGVRGTGRAVGVARVASSLHAHHRHCLPLVCRGGVYSLHAAAHPGGLNPAPYPPLPPPRPARWHPGGLNPASYPPPLPPQGGTLEAPTLHPIPPPPLQGGTLEAEILPPTTPPPRRVAPWRLHVRKVVVCTRR